MTKDRFQSLLINQGLHHSIADHIDESWYELFENLLPELKEVFNKLYNERYRDLDEANPGNIQEVIKTIYPSDTLIFRAFKLCKLTDLKVIVLGQDVFHDGSSIGTAFDNVMGKKISPSLQNIIKEVTANNFEEMSNHPHLRKTWLEHWPNQGVLLLNTALTVEKGKPGSHLEIWKPFTQKLLGLISAKQDKIVWCLWGAKALAHKDWIVQNMFNSLNKVDKAEVAFIISSHPSPLGANKPMQGYPAFIGSKPFSRINKYLKEWGKTEIKW